ncbi:hypothetical protein [Rhizobium halophytocola]|uniref:DUF3329 domain-containing protein n=1 Tax=Rhizobium halophytocola TaxID=735519 RepID=A0ABS4E134_9HYPH|nr:hypothetical protein [Rhizobium halophytocola]MBP1851614.1 hypothetical protein [Rhizobium halophytocola]
MKLQILDPAHPFFKPLWRRILTALFPALWALVEISNGQTGWAIAFLAIAAYAAWELLIRYDPSQHKAPDTSVQQPDREPDET